MNFNNDFELEIMEHSLDLGMGAHLQADLTNKKCTWPRQHAVLLALQARIRDVRGDVNTNVPRVWTP